MCNLINKECEEMCRPSTHSSFCNSSFLGMTSLTIQKTVYELQTIAPTLWKVLQVSVSPNMTSIDNNEKFQAHTCMAAACLLKA